MKKVFWAIALLLSAGLSPLAAEAEEPAAKLYFETGKVELPADATKAIGTVAESIKAKPDAKVEITGFADASGSPEKNKELAKERAKAVREALKGAGVAEDHIVMKPPADITGTGDPKEARRVELMLADAGAAAAPATAAADTKVADAKPADAKAEAAAAAAPAADAKPAAADAKAADAKPADAKPADGAAPAAPAAAPPAPTKPEMVAFDKINSGDTAWMLTSTALVLFMTIPGLALFYGGMVRKKNVLATLMQSFAITCLISVIWMVMGYSLAFMPGSEWLGGMDRFFLGGMSYMKDASKLSVHHLATSIPESVFMMFQMTFAIITPALICGAFAERMKFSAMLWFMGLWSLLVYSPVAHWVWEPGGWLAAKGVLDFAGGTVVHINAGMAGLAAALVMGKRIGFGREALMPHNLTLTLIGASMLWVGWFGFNAGSAVAADGRAGMAMAVTHIAAAAAALAWMFAEWLAKGKPSVLGIASGAVAGLVAITPASGFVTPGGALAIGIIAGVICFWAATSLKRMLGYDDSLDAFGVHGVGGIVGAILTGVFASKEISGADGSIGTQLLGVVVTVVYSGVVSFIILKVIDMVIGLRVPEEDEREGLDVTLHGERVE